MAQFYTLEEAARVLGMSPEELTEKAQQRDIRAFLDGGTWQFRAADIDELARRRGLGSDAELRLSDLEVPAASSEAELEDLDLSEFQLGVAKADLGAESMNFPAAGDKPTPEAGSDHDLMFDDLSVPPNPVTGSSSVIIGMQSAGKRPSDSDVQLVPEQSRGSSDSDVRLASPDPDRKLLSDSDVTLIKDDTVRPRLPRREFGLGRHGRAAQPGGRLVEGSPGDGNRRQRLRAQSVERSASTPFSRTRAATSS